MYEWPQSFTQYCYHFKENCRELAQIYVADTVYLIKIHGKIRRTMLARSQAACGQITIPTKWLNSELKCRRVQVPRIDLMPPTM